MVIWHMNCRKLKPSEKLIHLRTNITSRGLRQSTRTAPDFCTISPILILNQSLWTYIQPVNDRCLNFEVLIFAFISLLGLFVKLSPRRTLCYCCQGNVIQGCLRWPCMCLNPPSRFDCRSWYCLTDHWIWWQRLLFKRHQHDYSRK